MSEEKRLPKGWAIEELHKITQILDKYRKPINASERLKRIEGKNQKELFPYYGATGIIGFIDDYLIDGEYVLLGEDAAPFLDPTKDVAYLIKGKSWVNNHAHILLSDFNNKFLLHYLNHFNYKGFVSGTTRLKLTQTSLKKIPVLVPPLPEQHRIVAKIEELFSSLDKGIESLKTAQAQLKVYRQAVLKWAFEGKFTNKDVKEGELPKGWEWKVVKNIASNIQYGYTESSSNIPIGPKFLRITDIQNNRVNWNTVPYCKIDKDNIDKYLLEDGDLVFARTGATVGKSFLIKGNIPKSVYASYLIRLRFPKDILDSYVWYYFQSPFYWNQILDKQVGTGQPNVNGTKLGNIKIIIPPFSEQQHIVSEIESRLSVCDKIEESISASLQQAEALRQSILKKAFEGKLVEQNPNDEPASALLERIKAERSKKIQNQKIKQKAIK